MPLIDIGKKAPAFTLKDQHDEKHALKDYAGGPVLLYFYPKDDTSTCTKQACQLQESLPDFERLGVQVLGISPQDTASKAKFAGKHDLTFPLLADPDSKVCEKYGVWGEKSMYGNTYMGVFRTTYLLDAAGKVTHRWDKVKLKGHLDAIMAALDEQ